MRPKCIPFFNIREVSGTFLGDPYEQCVTKPVAVTANSQAIAYYVDTNNTPDYTTADRAITLNGKTLSVKFHILWQSFCSLIYNHYM